MCTVRAANWSLVNEILETLGQATHAARHPGDICSVCFTELHELCRMNCNVTASVGPVDCLKLNTQSSCAFSQRTREMGPRYKRIRYHVTKRFFSINAMHTQGRDNPCSPYGRAEHSNQRFCCCHC